MARTDWTTLEPSVTDSGLDLLLAYARKLARLTSGSKSAENTGDVFDKPEAEVLNRGKQLPYDQQAAFRAIVCVITDLTKQGWKFKVQKGQIKAALPSRSSNAQAEKKRVRTQLHLERDKQLEERAVRTFIESMEKKRTYNDKWTSIFSLMRDGRKLSEKIRTTRETDDIDDRIAGLRSIIDPYIQIVSADEKCEFTGLRLMDIWRYFRHTWAIPYRSTPGRTMMLLVRDRAVENHPVIGIASLASSAIQISDRDRWIGWHTSEFIASLRDEPSESIAQWLVNFTDRLIDEIYRADFIEDKVLSVNKVADPPESLFSELRDLSQVERERHNRYVESGQYKNSSGAKGLGDEHWLAQARSHLFRSKRAESLAALLRARRVLLNAFKEGVTATALKDLLDTSLGRTVVAQLLKRAKSERVGTAMADISICGAVAPYNELLGGKLVSMLLTSPETCLEMKQKYIDAPSIIASSMAGKEVIREADLVLLMTTSLYGVGSSQYNRIKIPCDVAGGDAKDTVSYIKLGLTSGFGSLHFSTDTVEAISHYLTQQGNGLKVHSIFGEGVSPRMRKIRDGLGQLGLNPDKLMAHGSPRLIYGIPLAKNFSKYLVGLEHETDYLFDMTDPKKASDDIVEWWMTRWLSNRINNDDVLKRVEGQTLAYPITHGARVELPEIDDDQPGLFEDL